MLLNTVENINKTMGEYYTGPKGRSQQDGHMNSNKPSTEGKEQPFPLSTPGQVLLVWRLLSEKQVLSKEFRASPRQAACFVERKWYLQAYGSSLPVAAAQDAPTVRQALSHVWDPLITTRQAGQQAPRILLYFPLQCWNHNHIPPHWALLHEF